MICIHSQISRLRYPAMLAALLLLPAIPEPAYGQDIVVQLDVTKAGPRKVEAQTEGRVLADYRLAWADIAEALSSNIAAPINVLFVGSAKNWLNESISSQQQTGLATRYTDQSHKVQAVFYAPEGDLIELHDTANFQTQVLVGGKLVHEDQNVHHYVVLMTPGADRWVVRELLEVPQF
jgi:hypothetical protein